MPGDESPSGRPPTSGQPWTVADEDVLVRPFGYVHDEAVVVRVDDREAYIGNVHAADPSAHEHAFAHVLTLTDDPQPSTTHHRPFEDSLDHDAAAFRDAVDTARTLLARDGATLVHCRAGVSRSSAVLATAIAATGDRRFRDALDDVQTARPFAMPNPALVESAVVYLAADADREPNRST
ncbi:dual specificity protein phosphatase family protein [Halorubellus sp. JP-L1]|uniref:dual specificity protein phosphatase family protein n=1 Tax=Halorubellus sp. JP-L1 TaxID=2715753 RepID=UPI00140C5273|nr:dual specificity protein phosphatase [Halorubellus sp. JP-L1]NHN42571.1 dual specificity protein phosphatase family protein [Halorubellus sp. JP-L1]